MIFTLVTPPVQVRQTKSRVHAAGVAALARRRAEALGDDSSVSIDASALVQCNTPAMLRPSPSALKFLRPTEVIQRVETSGSSVHVG